MTFIDELARNTICLAFCFILLYLAISRLKLKSKTKAKNDLIDQFHSTLARTRKMLYDASKPETGLEHDIHEFMGKHFDPAPDSERNPVLVQITGFIYSQFKPLFDQNGLYYYEQKGNTSYRVYPLLENIYSSLETDGIFYLPDPSFASAESNLSLSVEGSKNYKTGKGKTLQPKRPQSKPVRKRTQELLAARATFMEGGVVEFA